MWLFAELAADIYRGDGLWFDESILRWFYDRRSEALTGFMFAISVVGDVPATVAISLLLTALLAFWWRLRREALFFALAMGGASLVMITTKLWIGRERPDLFPDGALYPTASPSFPSGHATGSAALYLALFLIVRRCAPRWSWPMALFGATMALTITVSRLYLGVHYPSDVLAGLALGAGWTLIVDTLVHRDREHRFQLVSLSRELSDRLERRAIAAGVSEDELVSAALERYLDDPPPDHGERAAAEVDGARSQGG